MLFSCSKDAVDIPIDRNTDESFWNPFKEYNINKEGLILELSSVGLDTTQLFINGRYKERLWIGCYNKITKEQIFEWTESEKLDTVFHLNIGYGDFSDVNIERFVIRSPYYVDKQLYFILQGRNHDRIVSSDLYFIKNKSLIRKNRSFAYPDGSFYQDIKPWYNSIFSKYNQDENICFSLEGDSLFIYDDTFSTIKYSEPISIEECIEFNQEAIGYNLRNCFFKRKNLKTNKTIWSNDIKPFENLPLSARIDDKSLEKDNNIWTYSYFYTLIDGSKHSKVINIDIESGELTIKK